MKRPSESGFLQTVLAYAKLRGWRCCHQRPARTATGWRTAIQGDAGFPDLVLARAGRVVFAELKMPGGKLSPEQVAWLEALRGTPAETYVWRPGDWPQIEAVLA